MKLVIGMIVSMLVGAACRWFDIPVGSPPVLGGALLVVAMTIGYSTVDKVMTAKGQVAVTKHLCGGPTGSAISNKNKDGNAPEPDAERTK